MLRIATVNFGHVDVSLPLYKKFQNVNNIEFTHYFCFALNRKSESILNFENINIGTGFVSESIKKLILKDDLIEYLNNKIDNIKFFIFYNLKLRSFKNFILSFKLYKELKKFDIVHFNGLNGVLPILIFLLRKKRLIFTIHDIRPHSGDRSKFGLVEKMVDFICKSKFPVIVQNKDDYQYCINLYNSKKSKFFYIPFGILDVYKCYKKVPMPESDILFFGRIAKYKGLEYLIEAIKILKQDNIEPKVVIAGSGFIEETLLKQIKEYNVTLINRYISNEELCGLLNNTKIVVCPYTDATQSGVIMTAFAFEKPVIATKVGSFKEIVIEDINGYLCEPKNSMNLANKIKVVLNNLNQNKKFFFTDNWNYNWDNILEKYLNIYQYFI